MISVLNHCHGVADSRKVNLPDGATTDCCRRTGKSGFGGQIKKTATEQSVADFIIYLIHSIILSLSSLCFAAFLKTHSLLVFA